MKILVAGDFCPQHRVSALLEGSRYNDVLGDVRDVVTKADYALVNFECAITKGAEQPIEKCGPNLHCTERGIEVLKWAGFNTVTLANNHFYDYGNEGVRNTLVACETYGIDVVGGGNNIMEASKTLYKKINGETLGIINCCEHEFSIATETMGGSNPLNPIQQYYAIQEAKQHADYVLVIVHGGHEHYQLPSPRMQETYRFFVDAGADAVVNHHQHCYSGYEIYQGKLIFYGLGNFCFDNPQNRYSKWNEGYMVMLEMDGKELKYELIPYVQCNGFGKVEILPGSTNRVFFQNISALNSIISDKDKLESEYIKFLNMNRRRIRLAFSPYTSRLCRALCHRSLLYTFLSKRKKIELLAYLQCESYYDSVLNFLKTK